MDDAQPAPAEERRFAISFSKPGVKLWLTSLPKSRWKWIGPGQIAFLGPQLTLSGSRHRMLLPSAPQEVQVTLDSVWNVAREGDAFRCDVVPQIGSAEPLQFWALKPGEAQAIQDLLPTRQTEAFTQARTDTAEFIQRLVSLGNRAVVTPALVVLNVLVFAFLYFQGAGFVVPNGEVAAHWGSNFGPMTLGGQWWRLLTCTFIHFGIFHLALNMFALYQTGCLVERMYGSGYFLVLYLFAGLSGSVVSILWHPLINSAGASGAIFGVFGGLLVFVLKPDTRVPATVMKATRNSTIGFVAFNLANGFAHAGIDNGAHLGGLVGGALMGLLLARPLDPARRESPFFRVAAAATLGTLLLVSAVQVFLGSGAGALQEVQFERAADGFAAREADALNAYRDTLKRLNDGKLDKAAAAREIEQFILPRWGELHDSLAGATLKEGSRQRHMQYELMRYCDLRQEHLRRVSAALRTGTPWELNAAQLALHDVVRQAELVRQLGQSR